MSCGGSMLSGFSCGARRFEKYKFTTDKPSNPVLHTENEKKLNDLLRIREEQDKKVFPPVKLVPVILKNDVTHKNSKIAETFVIPEYATPLGQGQILYYPTSDVKEKRD
jgi:hypothetical protein